jgi:hypothetical protein
LKRTSTRASSKSGSVILFTDLLRCLTSFPDY